MENTSKTDLTEEFLPENLSEEDAEKLLTDESLREKLPEGVEVLEFDELSDVSGGTVNEYSDLLAALSINPKLQKWGRFAAHLPGGNLVALNASDGIKGILKKIDIKADISVGLGGTGLFSSNNKYTRISTGESMTHEEVIAEMKRHFTLD